MKTFFLGLIFLLASTLLNIWLGGCLQRQVVLNERSLEFSIYLGLIFGQLALGAVWLVYGRWHVLVRLPTSLALVWLLVGPIVHSEHAMIARPFFVGGIYLACVSLILTSFRASRYVMILNNENPSCHVNDLTGHLQFSLGSLIAGITATCLFCGLARQIGVDRSELTNVAIYLLPFIFTAFLCWSGICAAGSLVRRVLMPLAICPVVAGLVGMSCFPGVHGMATFTIASIVECFYLAGAWIVFDSAGCHFVAIPARLHEPYPNGSARVS